jgi:hypothetical protein
MSTNQTRYRVEYICWEPDHNSEDSLTNELSVSDRTDDRTFRYSRFDTKQSAMEHINNVKAREGKWLAWIKLYEVVEKEIAIDA